MAQVIFRRGQWYSDFRHNGKRIRRPLSPDKREAQIELGRLMDRLNGRMGTIGTMPWKEFKDQVFAKIEARKSRKRPNTLLRDRASLATLENTFPITCPADVTPELLDRLIDKREAQGKKPSTIRRELGSIKAFMRRGERFKLCNPQEWRDIEMPLVANTRPPHHTKAQLADLIRYCKGVWKRIAWIGGRAGLRRGEIWALEKKDVRFDDDMIRIRPKDWWKPKDEDARDILLLPDLKAFLREEFKSIRGERVLADSSGKVPSVSVMSTYFKRLTRKAGLKGNIHTLRHSWLTHLANDGVNIHALQKWAGHSTIKTTMGYVHPATEYRAEIPKITPLDV